MVLGRTAVCSWSLRPTSSRALVAACGDAGIDAVQLALDPLRDGRWKLAETRRTLTDAGIAIVSGMMSTEGEDYTSLDTIRRTGGLRPVRHWETNAENARVNAENAAALGIGLVTLHAGFLPESDEDEDDSERATMLERLDTIATIFAESGVRLGLETGQETAKCLIGVLDELGRTDVGVNFDPANMVLYGMGDPISALEKLGSRVLQVHVKDAEWTTEPGTWGTEVPAGTGAVDWSRFFDLVAAQDATIDVVIEREAGEERVEDVARARELIEQHSSRVSR
jgi:L-ribulose-5-phosphate 3-epimerase